MNEKLLKIERNQRDTFYFFGWLCKKSGTEIGIRFYNQGGEFIDMSWLQIAVALKKEVVSVSAAKDYIKKKKVEEIILKDDFPFNKIVLKCGSRLSDKKFYVDDKMYPDTEPFTVVYGSHARIYPLRSSYRVKEVIQKASALLYSELFEGMGGAASRLYVNKNGCTFEVYSLKSGEELSASMKGLVENVGKRIGDSNWEKYIDVKYIDIEYESRKDFRGGCIAVLEFNKTLRDIDASRLTIKEMKADYMDFGYTNVYRTDNGLLAEIPTVFDIYNYRPFWDKKELRDVASLDNRYWREVVVADTITVPNDKVWVVTLGSINVTCGENSEYKGEYDALRDILNKVVEDIDGTVCFSNGCTSVMFENSSVILYKDFIFDEESLAGSFREAYSTVESHISNVWEKCAAKECFSLDMDGKQVNMTIRKNGRKIRVQLKMAKKWW